MNVKVKADIPTQYGIADRAVAEGLYNIELIQEDGTSYIPPVNLLTVTGTVGTMSTLDVANDTMTGKRSRYHSWRRTIDEI